MRFRAFSFSPFNSWVDEVKSKVSENEMKLNANILFKRIYAEADTNVL